MIASPDTIVATLVAGDCPLDTLPSPRWRWRMAPTTVGVKTTPPTSAGDGCWCRVGRLEQISNGYNYILERLQYILERNLQVARLLGAYIELLGASLEILGASLELRGSSLELLGVLTRTTWGPSLELLGASLELRGASLELLGASLELL